MRILVFLPISKGGIADYAHDQAEALVALGHQVIFLAPTEFHKREGSYDRDSSLKETRPSLGKIGRLRRRLNLTHALLSNYARLFKIIVERKPDHVLTHFEEYLAPLWVPQLKRLRAKGVVFHTVLHDPERNYVVGPKWWHSASVEAAFSLYHSIFVHHRPGAKDRQDVVQIPHGIHAFPKPSQERETVRASYGIKPDSKLMVSFGYIRDNKNIDLVIRAMQTNPDVELVVAGTEQGGGQRPFSFYNEVARMCDVADRCHFDIRFFSQNETADLIAAADIGLLTYARSFVSASAAFSLYANYECPALISSGSSEMERVAHDYRLGVWIEPDDAAALESGLRSMMAELPAPLWSQYKADHSWARNAELVAFAMKNSRADT